MLGEVGQYATRVLDWWRRVAGDRHVAVYVGFFVVLLLLTLLLRGRRSWSLRATLGVLTTVVLVFLNLAVTPILDLLLDGLRGCYDALGVPRLPAATWTHVPAWLVALVAVVAHDLANYWNHRLMHLPLLWPVHAIHHAEPDVNGMTSFRVHALEPFVMVSSHVLLLGWLSLPADALGVVATVLILHNMYVHADLDWHHGPLALLIASPRYHRWHHADVPEAYGKNLANVVPLFDVLFGTYHCPGPCDAPLGAAGVPRDPLRLFLYPGAAWVGQLRSAVSRALGRPVAKEAAPAPAPGGEGVGV